MNKSHIMIHHSLTKDSGTASWAAIQTYHVSNLEWPDIGYHYGIENILGNYYALLGCPEHVKASACYQAGMNTCAIHICCVGNFDEVDPPESMLKVLVKRLVLPLMERYNITKEGIVFHRDYAEYKSCPGSKFTKEMILEKL